MLINDNTFYPFFSKEKDKNIIIYGMEPLKTLGKDIEGEFLDFGNVARNFMISDGLYLPNKYSAERLLGSLDLDGVLKTNVFIAPSPRNSLLFDKNRSEIIKEELSLKIKGLCLYADMERKQKDDSVNFTEENILTSLEKKLPDDVVVFYKLHSMVTKVFSLKEIK